VDQEYFSATGNNEKLKPTFPQKHPQLAAAPADDTRVMPLQEGL